MQWSQPSSPSCNLDKDGIKLIKFLRALIILLQRGGIISYELVQNDTFCSYGKEGEVMDAFIVDGDLG